MNYFILYFTFISLFLSMAFQGFSLEMDQEMDLINNLNGFGKGMAGIYKHAEQQKRRRVAAVDADSGSNPGAGLPCLQKLLPCQPYLKSPSPPPTCCAPLNEVVTSESQCLCKVFTDPDILKGFNLTRDQAMDLPKNCGINADTSKCAQGSSPGPSPTDPSTPGSSGGDSSNTPKTSDASATIIHDAAEFWLVALFLAIIMF